MAHGMWRTAENLFDWVFCDAIVRAEWYRQRSDTPYGTLKAHRYSSELTGLGQDLFDFDLKEAVRRRCVEKTDSVRAPAGAGHGNQILLRN